MEKSKKRFSPLTIAAAVLLGLLILSASVTITLFDKSAYSSNIKYLGIPEDIGIGESEIIKNYNALIDYNSIFYDGELNFPSLPMSDEGREHFREVKVIFCIFQVILIISIIGTAALGFLLLRKRRTGFIVGGALVAIAVPAAVAISMLFMGWDRFFVLFHRIVFDNDYWIFDSDKDPVILILPDSFFLQCLIKIIAGIVIPAIAILIFMLVVNLRMRENRLPRGVNRQPR